MVMVWFGKLRNAVLITARCSPLGLGDSQQNVQTDIIEEDYVPSDSLCGFVSVIAHSQTLACDGTVMSDAWPEYHVTKLCLDAGVTRLH